MSRGIFTALLAIGLAQFLKIPIKQLKTKKWNWKTFFESGGMPSSHSAGVASLATYIGLRLGGRTLDFALSVIFGLIVMYDAQGIRRYAGETSMKVNELEAKVEKLAGESSGSFHEQKKRQLKEQLGHQPEEVVAGASLGVIVGSISYMLGKMKGKN
ncbi:divergent PAP2 family protein [Evansella cellulosilytica]|uniref:Acid phosphatase/vanadium-dependent haloperoxidase related protein n=1 Tax=Evansella cellulosilytica (strain ATCC 21833 / DSM 2522 / FERM P-1141 / JCM 9156 / N-4) TaxID=649639 RepID=E6TWS5_EVAC2|nr:divergent PAP2 family protein [Evansella cellulosilytica]ADU28758.1 acid phosphatase/vanadium-dependent haloperoxidase related protein [Evansella cellulosilytica DSM 2522]